MVSTRYTFTRGEADEDDGDGSASMQGRCKEEGKSSQGVIIYSSFQAILVGVHDPQYSNGIGFGKANTEMGKVVDYMLENNY